MHIVRPRPLTPADIGRAAVVGVVAGTVSAGWRWLIFRYEAKRRTKRLRGQLNDAAKSFASVVDQATKGMEQMARGGKVPPVFPGGIDVVGPFRVGPDELDRIFEDLNQARRESGEH